MTKVLDNSKMMTSQPAWLLNQAIDYYRISRDHRSPHSRLLNRRKFVAAIEALLPITGSQPLLAAFGANNQYGPTSDGADAREIITRLAGEQHPARAVQPTRAAEPVPARAVETDPQLVNHLAAAAQELAAAIKLINAS